MPARATLSAGVLQRGDDAVEVGAGVCDGQAAQAVVAAELDDDDGGMRGEDLGQALDAVLGGVAADALVVDAVVEVEVVEVGLEVVGVALAGADAAAGGEAIAEADEDGAVVVGLGFGARDCGAGAGWARSRMRRDVRSSEGTPQGPRKDKLSASFQRIKDTSARLRWVGWLGSCLRSY